MSGWYGKNGVMILSFSSEKIADRGYFSGVQPLVLPPRFVSLALPRETDSLISWQANDFDLSAGIVNGFEKNGLQCMSGLFQQQGFHQMVSNTLVRRRELFSLINPTVVVIER
jgi:hypothetical protein